MSLIACGCLLAFGPRVSATVVFRLPESALIEGLAVGASATSFEPLTLFESIEETRRSGAHVLEIRLGQALSPTARDVSVSDGMPEDQTVALRRKVASSSAKLVAARVRFSNNHSANTRLFEWADSLEIQVLVGEPPLDQFDNLEKLIRKYNIGVGLWTGPKSGASSTSSTTTGRGQWQDPKAVLNALRGRDPRFGVVVNVLNLVRAGVDPFQAIADLRTRLLGIQLTDISGLTPQSRPMPFGTGRFDFRRLLTQLDGQRFDGYIVFDWPAEQAEFKDDLRKGLEFFRGHLSVIQRENRLRLAARGVNTPAGLDYEVLVQGDAPEPIHVAMSPDGTPWVGSRRGFVWTWSESARTNLLAGRLPVNATGQRGLHAFAFDPGFLTNGYLYVYRSPMLPVGNSNRVSRFTAKRVNQAWQVEVESEKVLLDIPSAHHGQGQGGGLLIHPVEQCLYVGTGDNNLPGETPRFYDDPKNPPQDPASLLGKILRVRLDGSVPADNPWAQQPKARAEVFALGFRNPVTLTWEPATGRIFAGDVGFDRREDREEINLLKAGGNYGWPRCDGRGLETLPGTPCPIPDAVEPWFSYPHDSAAAVVVGPFFSGKPPAGWPAAFGNGLVYADFPRRSIRFAQVSTETGKVTNTVSLASGLAGGPISLSLAADGSLYLVEYAGWLAGSPQDRLARLVPRAKPAAAAPGSTPAR
ncbi:MAG: PQQ-dependent sugar dehydrogenase [Verrucomicrobiales bacterium]|nr:PQQ-dependent sugar dehydrogenase [Verrucomicrobiales bacterium]